MQLIILLAFAIVQEYVSAMENQVDRNDPVLPRKLSELIELGLKSLEECENDPDYKIDMLNWHLNDSDQVCKVCLSGSIMAKILRVEKNEDLSPRDLVFKHDLNYDDCDALEALNDLRCGSVCMAAQIIDNNYSDDQKAWLLMDGNRTITQYDQDEKMFKNEMRVLADELKEMEL